MVAIDPSPAEFNFISQSTNEPNVRGILAYTQKKQLEDMQLLIGAKKSLVFIKQDEAIAYSSIPRMFAIATPLNESESAKMYKQNLHITALALQFPNIPPHASIRQRFTDIYIPGEGTRESESDFRDNL